MSSYIVEEKTINRILSFLKDHNTTELTDWEIRDWISKQRNFYTNDDEDLTSFGRKLYKMNIKAVNKRYAGKTDETFLHKYEFVYTDTSIEQVFNSIRCFTYQCSEGKVPNSKLYKQMERLETGLARMIAYREVEKANVEWG